MPDDLIKLKERLLKYSKWNGECLESTYKSVDRYAHVKFNRKMLGAHKASWLVHFGEVPTGLWVLHKCDNPLCIRPEHLFLGTPKENAKDMREKRRDNYKSIQKHSDQLANEAIQLRRSGKTHKEISIILNISMGSLNSIFRRKHLKDQTKDIYNVPKYPKEIREKAWNMREKGIPFKEIYTSLGIPKRTLCEIYKKIKEKDLK